MNKKEQIIEARKLGKDYGTIVAEVGCNYDYVKEICRKYNLQSGKKGRKKGLSKRARQALKIVEECGELEKAEEITGFTRGHIRTLCRKNGIEWKKKEKRAPRSSQRAKTEERIKVVISFAEKGYTRKEIADEIGCTERIVDRCLKKAGIKAKRAKKKRRLDHEAMREYFAEGYSAQETAEQFGTTVNSVRKICRGIRPGNQYTNGLFDREANAKQQIAERTPNFEYAGNFTGVDGYVDLKCKTCGTIIRKSFVAVRHGTARCDECYRREREQRKEEKQQQKEKRQKEERKFRKYKIAFKKQPQQAEMKFCPICGNPFIGGRKYCSQYCASQNKWQMKEGYRHKFPLDEVYKRGRGICYICGGLCDWEDYTVKDGVTVYGDYYPSRDHVIPKSKGGQNSWENIRLAHRICNSKKANIPLGEFLA